MAGFTKARSSPTTALGGSEMSKPVKSIVVQLSPNCWLADWEGDPGRTTKIENAKQFKSERAAKIALTAARKFRPFPDAEIQ